MTETLPARDPEPGRVPPPATDDEAVDLSDIRWDDSLVLVIFWALAGVVFLQFFTRYVLNDSLGWTEEIARFLLIGVTFVGAIMAVRKRSHVAVEVFYRWMPYGLRRTLSTLVDLVSVVFFTWGTWVAAKLALKANQMMVSIDLPKSIVYWSVSASFAVMALYAAINAVRHWRSRSSPLIEQGDPATRA